jgi:two-component system, chemotaxis family, chemotaxis protein CheY
MARVLIVDDVDVVTMALRMLLERAGYTVETAGDGNEAMSLVGLRPPDVAITDLWMPIMDGLALIRALRERFPAVAVIAMSGGSRQYNQASSLDKAREAGATQLLMKPIDRRDLLIAVAKAIPAQRRSELVPNAAL